MDTYMQQMLTLQPSYRVESVDWNKSSQQKKKKNAKSFLQVLEENDEEDEEETTNATTYVNKQLGEQNCKTNVVELYQYMAPRLRQVK